MSDCPNRFALVQYHAGELPEPNRRSIERHIDQCERCSGVIERFEQNKQQGLEQRQSTLSRIRRLADADPQTGILPTYRQRPKGWWRPALGVAASAAVVIIAVLIGTGQLGDPPDKAVIAYRGAVALHVSAYRNGHRFKLDPDRTVRRGDRLTVEVTVSSPGYVALFSMDRQGKVTPLDTDIQFETNTEIQKFETAGRHLLKSNLVVDQEFSAAHIIVAFSQDPFDASAVQSDLSSTQTEGSAPAEMIRMKNNSTVLLDSIAVPAHER